MRFGFTLTLLFLCCTTRPPEPEKLLAAPDKSQPGIAIVGPPAPQEIRPQQLVPSPTPGPSDRPDLEAMGVPREVIRAGDGAVTAWLDLRDVFTKAAVSSSSASTSASIASASSRPCPG